MVDSNPAATADTFNLFSLITVLRRYRFLILSFIILSIVIGCYVAYNEKEMWLGKAVVQVGNIIENPATVAYISRSAMKTAALSLKIDLNSENYNRLKKSLILRPHPKRLIEIKVSGNHPQLVKKILSQYVEAYNSIKIEKLRSKIKAISDQKEFIDSRTSELRSLQVSTHNKLLSSKVSDSDRVSYSLQLDRVLKELIDLNNTKIELTTKFHPDELKPLNIIDLYVEEISLHVRRRMLLLLSIFLGLVSACSVILLLMIYNNQKKSFRGV